MPRKVISRNHFTTAPVDTTFWTHALSSRLFLRDTAGYGHFVTRILRLIHLEAGPAGEYLCEGARGCGRKGAATCILADYPGTRGHGGAINHTRFC